MKLPEPIAEFNRAVEWADRLLEFRHDRLEPLALHAELIAAGMPGAARQLWRAGKPLGYFNAGDNLRTVHYRSCDTHKGKDCTCGKIQAKAHNALFPVDKVSAGMVKTKTAVRKQQRKAKK